MTDLFQDILNHLKDSPTYTEIDITDFIKQLPYTKTDTTEGTISIFKTFHQLNSKKIVIPVVTNSDGQTFQFDEPIQEYLRQNTRITFDTLKVVANITSDGKNYIQQRERDINQDSLTESVKTTNYWVKRTSIASVGIALVTLLYIALDYHKDTSTNLEPLIEQLKLSQQKLDSIAQYQKQTEATLRKIQEGLPVKP